MAFFFKNFPNHKKNIPDHTSAPLDTKSFILCINTQYTYNSTYLLPQSKLLNKNYK